MTFFGGRKSGFLKNILANGYVMKVNIDWLGLSSSKEKS